MNIFPASPVASQNSDGKVQPQVSEVNFDGYTQRIANSINNLPYVYGLSWKSILATDRDTFIAFLESMGSVKAFTYTLPDRSNAQVFTCKTWSWRWSEANLVDFNATFEQKFEVSS